MHVVYLRVGLGHTGGGEEVTHGRDVTRCEASYQEGYRVSNGVLEQCHSKCDMRTGADSWSVTRQ